MRTHLSLLLLLSACTEEPFNPSGADDHDTVDAAIQGGDEDASTSEPDASTSGEIDSGSEPDAGAWVRPRCSGGDYDTAPSGAACDPTRIHGAGILSDCYAPPKGQECDELVVALSPGMVAPAGVECTQNGSAPPSCHWIGDADAGAGVTRGTLDDATLEGLCALTESDPELVVRCWVYE